MWISRTSAAVLAMLSAASLSSAADWTLLRTSSGQFLHLVEGQLVAGVRFPGDQQRFELIGDEDRFAIRAQDGRFLIASPPMPGGDRFRLVPAGGNRAGLEATDGSFVLLDPAAADAKGMASAGSPRSDQVVEIFRVGSVPETIRTELARLLRSELIDELGNQPYEKIRNRKKQRFIELPAPTVRDPKRKKRHRVLSMDEEYQVRVQLEGSPEVRIPDMPYLQGFFEPAAGALMFQIQARLPLTGRVRYRIPDVLSASTGFRATVDISAWGEVRSDKSERGASLSPPELLDLSVAVHGLDVSNDALNSIHEPLEDLVNEELHDNRDRLREKANRSLRGAIEKSSLRFSLLPWIAFPLKKG